MTLFGTAQVADRPNAESVDRLLIIRSEIAQHARTKDLAPTDSTLRCAIAADVPEIQAAFERDETVG